MSVGVLFSLGKLRQNYARILLKKLNILVTRREKSMTEEVVMEEIMTTREKIKLTNRVRIILGKELVILKDCF